MENKLTIKNSSIAFLSSVVLCQLGTLVFAAIGLIIASAFNITNEMFFTFLNTALGSLILSLLMDGIIVLIFLYFNKNKNNQIIKKPKAKKILIYFLLALICYILLYPIVVCFNSLIYKIFPANNLTYPLTSTNYFISLISMVLLPAVAEELIFRGVIFKGLQKGGNTFAIIISALMFALFHLSLEQTIYPFLMGLVLAVIMCYENNIIYCILLHFTNNFITLTLSYFKISLTFNHWTFYIIAAIFLIIFATTIALIINKLKNKLPLAKIEGESISYFTLCLSIVIILWLILQFSIIFKG